MGARPMSTSTRKRSRLRPGFARQVLACLLAVLFAVQPNARASSACSSGKPVSGGVSCCCTAFTNVLATSCCSTEAPSRDSSSESILSPFSRCTCEMQAPAPLSALPRESDLRGAERGSDSCFHRWIETGALASASTPFLGWTSPPGDVHIALLDRFHPFGDPTAAVLVRRPRGLLDLICIARC